MTQEELLFGPTPWSFKSYTTFPNISDWILWPFTGSCSERWLKELQRKWAFGEVVAMVKEGYGGPAHVDAPKRVAIYGGAFDPPTNSHLTCAAEIVHSGCADEVWLVPCGPRPDKPKLKTPAIDRYCMCQIAVNTVFSPDFPVKVSDIDTGRQMAAFTYDLLCSLRERHPGVQFAFIIGSDWLQPGTNIAEWTSLNHDWKPGMPEESKVIVTGHKLLEEFEFLVVPRPGYDVARTEEDPSGLKAFGPRLSWMQMPEPMHLIEGNLSSTEIRKRTHHSWQVQQAVQGGKLSTIEGLVPPGIVSYIRRARFYVD